MKLTHILHVFIALVISTSGVFGQTATGSTAPSAATETEKLSPEIEKKAISLLERAIGDADSLRLAENRVYIFGSTGALLWTRDEKRARQLFRRAANELGMLTTASEDDGDELPESFWLTQNARNQFLNQVASRDAELAIEFLRQTRPPVYSRMLGLPGDKIKIYRNLYQQAQSDLNLEKEFSARLIKQNPRRALEIARANLSKGASYSDLNLINHLKKAEPELASKFADEVLQKLLDADISDPQDYNARGLVQTFLSQFSEQPEEGESKEFKIDKNVFRRLAVKYADYLSSSALPPHGYQDIQTALPVFERILPERIAALRQRYERLKQNFNAQNNYNQFQEQFNQLAGKAAPEKLLEEAENYPPEMRTQIYGSAAGKMAQAGNYAAGRQLLASLPGKQARQFALSQYDYQSLQKFLSEEKYAEAEQIIAQQIDRSQKIRLLVQTAHHFSGKKQHEKAAGYVSAARSLVNPNPENYVELSDLVMVLSAGADGDAEKTFDLLESFVPKFNEIFAATAYLSKYQMSYNSFREGELLLTNNQYGFIDFGRHSFTVVNLNSLRLDRLGKVNLERAMRLADRFDRADVRIAARMMIVRGALTEEKSGESQHPTM